MFFKRTHMIEAIHAVLREKGFTQVETPMLQTLAGGASSRPFTTHHNALDIDLYLRISVELYLNRCIVGGLENVYDLGRAFRNEGISHRHSPEFTILECMMSYADYMDVACGAKSWRRRSRCARWARRGSSSTTAASSTSRGRGSA